MSNPFEKRATEYLRDDLAFLSVLTPDPLHTFFEKGAKDDSIFDRLCMVIGTPGSGKTTIARLLQYHTIYTLLNSPNHTEFTALHKALIECQIVRGDIPRIIGCRIPMESEYREIWELPYSEEVRFGLLKSILQSRAIILWIGSLSKTREFDSSKSFITYRDGTDVAKDSIGGEHLEGVLLRAKKVEQLIYDVTAGLVPPKQENLPKDATTPYHPFDVIEEIVVGDSLTEESLFLKPLVILDDVHSLHPKQLFLMRDWLAKRETKIARWIMMRLDAQTPESILNEGLYFKDGLDDETTIKKSREIKQIWLQGSDDRASYRRRFRQMARNMADRYLRLMPVFQRQGLIKFQDLLNTKANRFSSSKMEKLKKKIDEFQYQANISQIVRQKFEAEIERYCLGTHALDTTDELKLGMLSIMMNRYVKRVPQTSLFDHTTDAPPPEPKKKITADSEIADGARIHLFHEFSRPYYYGIDAVSDGSSENAEQFLQLAGKLVSVSEARIIRGDSPSLPPHYQEKLLRDRAIEIIKEWEFPRNKNVKRLCTYIGHECLAKSLEPNAALGGGANAFGILQSEFDRISHDHEELAQVLKFGVAYSALSIKPRYKVKNQLWTLIELTGPFIMTVGLTFVRGGFLERTVRDLLNVIEDT